MMIYDDQVHMCVSAESAESAYTLNADGRNGDEKKFTVVVNVPVKDEL